MKIFSAVLAHESSSFSPIPTSLESYREMLLYRPTSGEGRAALEQFAKMGPFARLAYERGHEFVQGIAAVAQPSAPTVRATFEQLRDELLDGLKAALPVDAVLLFLHGAQMAEGYDDCEGDLITRIRATVGADVFVGTVLDLHCNVTPAMASADVLLPCKEYPHTDWPERCTQLFDIAEAAYAGKIRPRTLFEPVPMLGYYHTTREPMRSFVDALTALEGRDGILAANLAHGFPFSDAPHTGAGVILVVDGATPAAVNVAKDLAARFFALRNEINAAHPDLFTALNEAERLIAQGGGPVVLADVSDNPGGGAPGDSTYVLREILSRGLQRVAVATVWDPIAVQLVVRAGVGARLQLRIGGKLGPLSGDPLDVDAVVTAVNHDAKQELFAGQKDSLGPAAAIRVAGVDIVLVTMRQQTFSPDCFTEVGIDPRERSLLVVKSAQHFHAQFVPIARAILYCRAPGYMDTDYTRLSFTALPRPIWPLDEAPFTAHGRLWPT